MSATRTVRTPGDIMRDRALIASYYVKGWSQSDICNQMGLSEDRVSDDLRAIRKEWRESRIRDFDEAQAQELAKIDRLEREAWDAWERSQRDRETSTTEQAQGMNARQRVQFRKQGQTGNQSYLTTVQWCIDRRCKLLGLDAPERLNAHVLNENAPQGTIDERMAKYADLFQRQAIVVDGSARFLQSRRGLEADTGALPAGELCPPPGDRAGESLDSPRSAPEAGPIPDYTE